MQKIKAVYNGKEFNVDISTVLALRDVRAKCFVKLLKYKQQKIKAIKAIVKNRELIESLLDKSDAELIEMQAKLDKDKPLYDRMDIKGASIPFTF